MENNKSEIQTLEDLQALLHSYDEKLSKIQFIQEKTLKRAIEKSMRSKYNFMLTDRWTQFIVGIVVLLFFGAKYSLYIDDWRYLIPYIGFIISWIVMDIYGYIYILKMRAINPQNNPLVVVISKGDELCLFEKKDLVLSLAIGLPFMVASFVPVIFKLRGIDVYKNGFIEQHFAILSIGIIIAVACYVAYVLNNRRIIHQLKENITQYNALLNNK